MPADKKLWPIIEALAEGLDGSREHSESTLSELYASLKTMPEKARDEIRRHMILIVASLSRLEVRLIDNHGPLDAAV